MKRTEMTTNKVNSLGVPFIPQAQKYATIGKEWTDHYGDLNPLRTIPWTGMNAPKDEKGNPTELLVFFSLMPEANKEFMTFGGVIRAAEQRAGVKAFLSEDNGPILCGGHKVRLSRNRFDFVTK